MLTKKEGQEEITSDSMNTQSTNHMNTASTNHMNSALTQQCKTTWKQQEGQTHVVCQTCLKTCFEGSPNTCCDPSIDQNSCVPGQGLALKNCYHHAASLLEQKVNMTEVARLVQEFDSMSKWERVSALTDAFGDLEIHEKREMVEFMENLQHSRSLLELEHKKKDSFLLGTHDSSMVRREIVANATF